MAFKGSSVHTINESGRISIPSKMREQLKSAYGEEELVLVTRGKYVAAYPSRELDDYFAKLRAKSGAKAKQAMREINETLAETAVDKQGRILIPPKLRELAGLTGECKIIGMYDRIEIWDNARYEQDMGRDYDDGDDDIDDLLNDLMF